MKKFMVVIFCLICFCVNAYAENLFSLSFAHQRLNRKFATEQYDNEFKYKENGVDFTGYFFKNHYDKYGFYCDLPVLFLDEYTFNSSKNGNDEVVDRVDDSDDFDKYFSVRPGFGLALRTRFNKDFSLIGGVGGVFTMQSISQDSTDWTILAFGGSVHAALLYHIDTSIYLQAGVTGGLDFWGHLTTKKSSDKETKTLNDFSQVYIRPYIGIGIVRG